MKHKANWSIIGSIILAILALGMFVIGCVGCSGF